MRLFAVAIAGLLGVGVIGYFAIRPKQAARLTWSEIPIAEAHSGAVESYGAEGFRSAYDTSDDEDSVLVHRSLLAADLKPDEAEAFLIAAGRRYMRRKLAYADAQRAFQSGRIDTEHLTAARDEMELSRKVCDLAESTWSRTRTRSAMRKIDWELERRLAYASIGRAGLVDWFQGSAPFAEADLQRLDQEFQARYGRPLPVSARGGSTAHRALGFDHRGRFDIAISPERPEGLWIRSYLSARNVPFYAFDTAVPGKATGAHIHIGPGSTRRGPGD